MNTLVRFGHPAWVAGVATLLGYGLGLLALFVGLFVVPYLAFLAL